MENKNIIALIDLGTLTLKCAIFSVENGFTKLIASSKNDTQGIHNASITNFDLAVNSVKKCLADAEKKGKINLYQINVLINSTDIISTRVSKYKRIGGAKIEKNDISFLLKEAKKQVELNDSKLSHIHIFNCKYFVDNKLFKNLPINIFADQLSQENAFFSIPKNILKNIAEVFNACDIEINKFIFSSYALGTHHFNRDQIDYGCGIIDIGFEKTSVALFNNSALIHAAVFPIGSNHITKDIARGCYLTEVESELIKKDISIIQNPSDKFLPEKYFSKTRFRKISSKFVQDVIDARIDEILKKIFKEINLIQTQGVKHNLIFTGGGSKLNDLKKIINNKYSDCQINNDLANSNLSNGIDEDLLPCYGGAKVLTEGFASEAIAISNSEQTSKKGIFTRIFNVFN